jgi:hypothetical protein
MGEKMNSESTPKINDIIGKRDLLMIQFIMIAPCFFMRLSLDNDAYWIIQAGRNLIQDGVPHVDPLTFHEGLHYVMQQWLTAGIYAFLYDSIGVIGIFLFVLVIFILIVLVLFRLCLQISNHNLFISYVVTIFDVIILFLFMSTRPYPISMLIFLLEIFVLEKYLYSLNRKYLFAIPILSLMLINFHGAIWPFFFIIMVPYVIDSFRFKLGFVRGEGYPRRNFLLAFGMAFLIGFLNPYGWELMTYLFRSYGDAGISNYVREMGSPNFQNSSGMLLFAILLVVFLMLFLSKAPGVKLRYGLLILGTLFMTLSSFRNLSLFSVCAVPFLAYSLQDFIPKFNSSKKVRPKIQRMLAIIFLTVVMIVFAFRLNESRFYQDPDIPKNAVSYIITEYQDTNIRLFTGYNWGGYTEFRGLKPFIDARAEVFLKANNKKANILEDLISLDAGELHYTKFIEKYKLNVFLLNRKDLLTVYLAEDPQYVLVYEDQNAVVYKRITDVFL